MAPQTLAHEHLNEHLCSHSRRGSGRAQAPRGTLPAYGCFLFEEKSLVCNPRCRNHLEKNMENMEHIWKNVENSDVFEV